MREDVGRHNAVDKVIGARAARRARTSLAGTVMLLSGRAGFELVQKAAVARVPIVCSVSAPSALAVDLADEVGMTLVGFVRGGSANVYTHPRRIVLNRNRRRARDVAVYVSSSAVISTIVRRKPSASKKAWASGFCQALSSTTRGAWRSRNQANVASTRARAIPRRRAPAST